MWFAIFQPPGEKNIKRVLTIALTCDQEVGSEGVSGNSGQQGFTIKDFDIERTTWLVCIVSPARDHLAVNSIEKAFINRIWIAYNWDSTLSDLGCAWIHRSCFRL